MSINEMISSLRKVDNEAVTIVLDRFESDRENTEAWSDIDKKQSEGYRRDALALVPVMRRLYNCYVDPDHKWYPGL